MKFKRMEEVTLAAKRVLIRSDLNVPLAGGEVSDDTRIRASVGAIRIALKAGARVMVTSHLGRPKEGEFSEADSLAPVARRLGALLGREVKLVREERASAGLALQLGLSLDAPVYHSLIVHFDNGLPLQCEDRYVNPAWSPNYLSVDFSRTTPTQHLLEVAPWWEAQYTIDASTPTAQEAELLGIQATDPCLVLVRRTVSHGVAVTLARLVHPGTRYQLVGQFSP